MWVDRILHGVVILLRLLARVMLRVRLILFKTKKKLKKKQILKNKIEIK